jgi:hypothetical protein
MHRATAMKKAEKKNLPKPTDFKGAAHAVFGEKK